MQNPCNEKLLNSNPAWKEIQRILYTDWNKEKMNLKWGTYGPDGKQPLRNVRLIDCSSDHLVAILCQPHVDGTDSNTRIVCEIVLAERGVDFRKEVAKRKSEIAAKRETLFKERAACSARIGEIDETLKTLF